MNRGMGPTASAPDPSSAPTPRASGATLLLNSALLLGVVAALVGGLWAVFGGPGDPAGGNAGSETDPEPPPGPQTELDRVWAELDRPWVLDVRALDAEWAAAREVLEAPTPGGAEEDALIAAFRALNVESASFSADPQRLDALGAELAGAVAAYLAAHDLAAFDRVGWRLSGEFAEAIEATLAAARERGTDPTLVLTRGEGDATAWRAATGNFFASAREQGYVDDDLSLTVDARLLRAAFRDRWLRLSGDEAALARIGDAERRALAGFRIERMGGIALHDRLVLIGRNEDLYRERVDPDAVRGLVSFRAGDANRARTFFARAARNHPEDPRYEAFLDYVVLNAR
jgi:hypothetical protein